MTPRPMADLQNDIAGLFLTYFQRAPEYEAMQWYTQQYIALIAQQGQQAFAELSSQLYQDGTRSGEVPPSDSLSNTQYVNLVYTNLLGREPEAGGQNYWTNLLNNNTLQRGELVAVMLDAALMAGGRDTAWVQNHQQVAVAFSWWQNSNPEILPTLPNNAAQVLFGITQDPATVATAMARLYTASANLGEQLTLTPQTDTLLGTERNDTFQALDTDPETSTPNVSTLTTNDHLDGGGGLDTLNIFSNSHTGANTTLPAGVSISNIQVVNIIHQGSTAAPGLTNASHYTDIEQLWQIYGTADVSELSSGTVAGFRAFHTLDVSVTAHHAAPQMHLAFDHPNFDTPNPSTLPTVHAHGANLNAIHIQGTLGGAPLRLDATVGTNTQTLFLNAEMFTVLRHATDTNGRVITHIDASASSGEVGVLVSQANMNIVGGSNNDSFNIVAGRLGPNLQLDGGGGSHNEVILHESDFSAQQYAFVNSFKNIQQLAFGAEFVTFDAAQWLAFNHLAFVQNEPNQDIDNHAIIHNLSASQTLQVDQGIVADITLANAAANVQAHVLRDGWLDLWIAAGQEGPTGGTLTLTGEAGGDVDFDNTWGRDLTTGDTTHLAHGKFAVIDASQLQGSLTLWDMAPDLAETVLLGAGPHNFLFIDALPGGTPSSSIGRLDTLIGFDPMHTVLEGLGQHREQIDLHPSIVTLSAAWSAAAQAQAASGAELIVFFFEGDTYLYANTTAPNATDYSVEDFGLRLTGEHDLLMG